MGRRTRWSASRSREQVPTRGLLAGRDHGYARTARAKSDPVALNANFSRNIRPVVGIHQDRLHDRVERAIQESNPHTRNGAARPGGADRSASAPGNEVQPTHDHTTACHRQRRHPYRLGPRQAKPPMDLRRRRTSVSIPAGTFMMGANSLYLRWRPPGGFRGSSGSFVRLIESDASDAIADHDNSDHEQSHNHDRHIVLHQPHP